MKNRIEGFCMLLALAMPPCTLAANAAPLSTILPVARMALGGGYELGGNTISNDSVASISNRMHGFLAFAPFSFLTIGIDAGATQMDVAADTNARDTFGIFHGNYGFSGGAHISLGTPFFYNGLFRVVCLGKATIFSSANTEGAVYGGKDGVGALGLQFHIARFGYITAGPQVYLIQGQNKSYSGTRHKYSNINNVRGWIALDFFPPDKLESKNKFFISLEASIGPRIAFGKQAPVQEFGFSVSLGSITKRLYGEESEVEWAP